MPNIMDEYLVKLGTTIDSQGVQKLEQVLRDIAHQVDSRALEMTASLVKWQAAATSAFAAVASAAVAMVDKVAIADQEYRLFGLTMYMNADAAKKLKITLDALGQPLGMVAWDKELSDRAERLEELQDKMQGALEREGFEENMKKARELRFQVSELEVDFMYLKDAIVSGLIKAFGPQIDVLIAKLQQFNTWFSEHLPEIRDKINKYLIPILKDAWRVLKDTVELLGILADTFSDVVNTLADGSVDEGMSRWEKFALAIEHCANAVAYLLDKLIAIEKFLAPHAGTIGGAALGMKVGGLFGPEGALIGGVGGAIGGGIVDLMRASKSRGTSSSGAGVGVASDDSQQRAQQAANLAQTVSAKTGIAPDLLWAQWAHETGGFTNRGARELNNLGGVRIPGSTEYRSFGSLDEFGDYYAHMMRPEGRYSGIEGATTPEDFSARLKGGGYYEAPQDQYTAGVERWDRTYQKRGYGGGGGGSTPVTIGQVNVHIMQPNASPEEVQARVMAGVSAGARKEIQRNLNEFQGVYA
jgi:hypothetical protein